MTESNTPHAEINLATEGRQFLTFALGAEEYGLEILKVQEIKGFSAITPIPNTPPYVRGVTNLRGAIIPVVDLRSRFGMAETEYTQFSVIIVVRVGEKVMGLIVDGVSDVLTISLAAIQPTPDFGAQVDARFVNGLAKAGDKLVVLLDIDKVLSGDDLAALDAASQTVL